MKTTNRSRMYKLIALILPVLFLCVFAQEHLFDYRNYDTVRIEGFYKEEQDSLDVIFIGASEVSNDTLPGYSYEKYGFTSYAYAMDSNQGSLYLSQLKEILKHQNPEILFVDLYGFLHADDAALFDDTRLRIYTESIPFSANKFQTVMQFPCEEKLSYFFPLVMYHGNPSIGYSYFLEVRDLLTMVSKPASLKGAQTRTVVYQGSGDPGKDFDPATYKLSNSSKAYLIEFLEYCKSSNLKKVVFTNFPRYIVDENNHNLLYLVDQAKSIVEEYGYPFLNLQNEMDAIGIDRKQDFYNEHHMNIYGQLKLSDYLGSKIVNEYGLTPRAQSEHNRLEWEACASNTQELIEIAKAAIQSGNDMAFNEKSSNWVYRK